METVQKVGKIVDIHFFENVALKKKLPVIMVNRPLFTNSTGQLRSAGSLIFLIKVWLIKKILNS